MPPAGGPIYPYIEALKPHGGAASVHMPGEMLSALAAAMGAKPRPPSDLRGDKPEGGPLVPPGAPGDAPLMLLAGVGQLIPRGARNIPPVASNELIGSPHSNSEAIVHPTPNNFGRALSGQFAAIPSISTDTRPSIVASPAMSIEMIPRSVYSLEALCFLPEGSPNQYRIGDPKEISTDCGPIVGYSQWYQFKQFNNPNEFIEWRYAFTQMHCVLIELASFVRGGGGTKASPGTRFELPDEIIKPPPGVPKGMPVVSIRNRSGLTEVTGHGEEWLAFGGDIVFYFPDCKTVRTIQLIRSHYNVLDFCGNSPAGGKTSGWDSDSPQGKFKVDGFKKGDPSYPFKPNSQQPTDPNGNQNVHQDSPGNLLHRRNSDDKIIAPDLLKNLIALGIAGAPRVVEILDDVISIFCCDNTFTSWAHWGATQVLTLKCDGSGEVDIGNSRGFITMYGGGPHPASDVNNKVDGPSLKQALQDEFGNFNPNGLC